MDVVKDPLTLFHYKISKKLLMLKKEDFYMYVYKIIKSLTDVG
jgi:hypothetical protein